MNNGIDLRGKHLPMKPCVICGEMYQPRTSIQETCGGKCAIKNRDAKVTESQRRRVPFEHRQRYYKDGSIVIIDAPAEYRDYVGMEYTSLEYQASLAMGTLPPGIIVEKSGVKYQIYGEPTPLDWALKGLGYKHQKAVAIR